MSKLDTVKIVNKDSKSGWSIINKQDLKDTDVLYNDAPKKKSKPAKKG